MILPTEKVGGSGDLRDYTLLAHGVPKVGKTTFFSRFDNALFLLTNPAPEALSLYSVPIGQWGDFAKTVIALEEEEHEFKVVVVDTLETLHTYCRGATLGKRNAESPTLIEHESDMGYGKGWDVVESQFMRGLGRLCSLPLGVVFISHTELKEIDTGKGKQFKYVPRLNKQAMRVANSLASHILYFEIAHDAEGNAVRQIRTRAAPLWEAGVRTDDGREMPDPLPMDADLFQEEFAKVFGKENDDA